MSKQMWASTRYSTTRKNGCNHTVATKLTETEYNRLHFLAVEHEVSDYEYLRTLIQAAISRV